MGIGLATEAQLRAAVEGLLGPVRAMLDAPWPQDSLGVHARAVNVAVRVANGRLTPHQQGVPAFDRLVAFSDASEKVARQRMRHVDDHKADEALEVQWVTAGEFLRS